MWSINTYRNYKPIEPSKFGRHVRPYAQIRPRDEVAFVLYLESFLSRKPGKNISGSLRENTVLLHSFFLVLKYDLDISF